MNIITKHYIHIHGVGRCGYIIVPINVRMRRNLLVASILELHARVSLMGF